MDKKQIEQLIDKYLDGATTPEEELQLAREVSRPDAPTEWGIIATMLGKLTLDEAEYERSVKKTPSVQWSLHPLRFPRHRGTETPSMGRNESEERKVPHTRSMSKWKGWSIAASIIVVAGIGLWFYSQQDSSTDIAIAYVDGQTITDEDRVLAMAEDAVCDIFSNSDAESSLYEIFNPEE